MSHGYPLRLGGVTICFLIQVNSKSLSQDPGANMAMVMDKAFRRSSHDGNTGFRVYVPAPFPFLSLTQCPSTPVQIPLSQARSMTTRW